MCSKHLDIGRAKRRFKTVKNWRARYRSASLNATTIRPDALLLFLRSCNAKLPHADLLLVWVLAAFLDRRDVRLVELAEQ